MKTVTAAIIERNGQVLIARRAPHSTHAGQWEFPGGKVEPGESLRQCLSRELHEELGIISEIGEHFCTSSYKYRQGSFKIEAFWTEWNDDAISLNDHDMVEWVFGDEIENYPLLPADVSIAKKLKQNLPPSTRYLDTESDHCIRL